ncbi:MAG: molybdopterin cofactor-binding domain-containing protein [Saprospiraceae bacterium]|nr:molybdopterin cofactor-binding domain-containing protein [Saprospiraceae bacterium]
MQARDRTDNQVTRRQFLRTSAGVTFVIGAGGLLPHLSSCTNAEELYQELQQHVITAWVRLAEDGTVTIFNPAAEMGQGSMTSLPMIFAEEMDADWDKVRVEFSAQEPSIYGSGGWGGDKRMLSAGSRVTKSYYPVMRQAGAQARMVLLQNVATHWQVPVSELATEPGFVVHQASDRRIGYGEIVPFLQIPESIPEIPESDLKEPNNFRLIGKDQPRTDIPAKVDGSARFAVDVRLDNMLYGVYERGRVHGARPTLKNEADILLMDGVIKVVSLDYAIGVIAERLEQALAAREKLDITWSDAPATGFNSQDAYDEYNRLAISGSAQGQVIVSEGDVRKAQRAYTTHYAHYRNDYVYHAQMEPLNAVVRVSDDGAQAEAWVGSQQGSLKMGIPQALGIPPENVKVNLMYLGGGLGRRSMTDFVVECAIMAKQVPGRPVKLIWTREDDLSYGAYRPMSLQRLEANVDRQGNLMGLKHIVVGDGDRLVASGIRNAFYDIPNQHAEIRTVSHGIRLKHWRAVGHSPNKFAIESMIDEIARTHEIDPVDYRRKLMSNSPRALATLEKAAEMSRWSAPQSPGRAKGVAFLERSGTLSTGVCEISVDRKTGRIRVHHVWVALDAGVVIHPDNVKAQVEGGVIMGMSSAFKEQITIVNGAVVQSNFDDYQLLRIEDTPESIEVAIIPSGEPPQGVGETGTPLVAGAVANAFLALTGKYLRHLPFTPERVLAALES